VLLADCASKAVNQGQSQQAVEGGASLNTDEDVLRPQRRAPDRDLELRTGLLGIVAVDDSAAVH
jgi:hypothetical protein